MSKMTGKEMAHALTDFVNTMANKAEHDAFVDTLMREHRTLQQSAFGLMIASIEAWAATERYDQRNANTVESCKEIVAAVDWLPGGRPPMI